MLERFLDPKNDFAFKKIFGEKNKDILIHFLNDILEFADGAQVTDLTFLGTIQDPEIASKKTSIVDVLCTDDLGRKHIVEMQVAKTEGFVKRAQYYAAKAYVHQINKGEEYHQLKEVIFLAIADFVMFPDKSDYKSDHVILDKASHEHDLKDFSFTFLELEKFNKKKDELGTMMDKWCYFFKHATITKPEELDIISGDNRMIKKAYHALVAANWTEEELNTYEAEKKRILDAKAELTYAWNDGMEKGSKEGMSKEKKCIAKQMLQEKEPPEKIMRYTGLSKTEIEKNKSNN